MRDSLAITVTRLVRAAFVVSGIIIIALATIALVFRFLDQRGRTLAIVFGSVPVVLFVVAHSLYEARGRASCLTAQFKCLSVAVLLWLLWPTSFIVLRHTVLPAEFIKAGDWTMVAILAVVCAMPMPFLDVSGSHGTFATIWRHMRHIMWSPCREAEFPREIISPHEVARIRSRFYVDRMCLHRFQQTLSTPELDAEAASPLVASRLARLAAVQADGVSVLDVGGGDGQFSRELFRRLGEQGIRIKSVTLLDPIDWSEQYASAMENLVETKHIKYVGERLESATHAETYDLVLASHCLYSACDNSRDDRRQRVEVAVGRVVAWARPGGCCLIALASRASRSYGFKESALRFLFGYPVTDLSAQDLYLVPQLRGATVVRVDNVIDLSVELDELEGGRAGSLENWLSYFLRYPVGREEAVSRHLIGMLRSYVQPLESLSEAVLPRLRALSSSPADGSRVLTHKTSVWVVDA